MKNRTKCFLTVIITYISMCIVAWLSVFFLITPGSDPIMSVIAAVVVSLGLSSAGVLLSRNQSKSILLSYGLTVCSSWLIMPLLYFVSLYILENIFEPASVILEIISLSIISLGFPGFMFGMGMGENLNSNPLFMYFVVYILCGLVPVAVTFISARFKKDKTVKES